METTKQKWTPKPKKVKTELTEEEQAASRKLNRRERRALEHRKIGSRITVQGVQAAKIHGDLNNKKTHKQRVNIGMALAEERRKEEQRRKEEESKKKTK